MFGAECGPEAVTLTPRQQRLRGSQGGWGEAAVSVLQGPYSEGQTSPSLLINHPFIREELEVREEEMLMGGCIPPFPNSAFPFAVCEGQVFVPEFPQAVKR